MPIRQGDIVWVAATDPRGNVKRRPVVVVSSTPADAADGAFVAVCITTTFPDPPPPGHVPIPWDPSGRSATRLRRRSAAVPAWLVTAAVGDAEETGGRLPDAILLQLLNQLPAG